MSTTNINAVQNGTVNGQGFHQVIVPVNSGFTINQGDLVYLDTSAHYGKAVDSDAHAATLLGVALDPSKVSSNLDNSSAPAEKGIAVGWGLLASMKTTAAETYVYGTSVYWATDAQTITTVTGTNKIGTVILPDNVASVTGAAGVRVPVLIKNNVV